MVCNCTFGGTAACDNCPMRPSQYRTILDIPPLQLLVDDARWKVNEEIRKIRNEALEDAARAVEKRYEARGDGCLLGAAEAIRELKNGG